jgi:hypothetical protein
MPSIRPLHSLVLLLLAISVKALAQAPAPGPVSAAASTDASACEHRADAACLQSFNLPGDAGRLRYYASQAPGAGNGAMPRYALVVMHGHPRDANRSFEAGLRSVTLAGFSAGAQMLQHSVAFAADAPGSVTLRYVIADPGTWLYFDPVRPQPRIAGQSTDWAACGTGAAFPGACSFVFQAPPAASACPGQDRWKYGLQALPGHLGRDAVTARSRYAAAQIDYLEGALDSSADKGAFYPILDKSCAAMLQGPFRLQRGRAFAAYEREVLAPQRPRRFVVVPDCAHDVACVLPSMAARPLLFPTDP